MKKVEVQLYQTKKRLCRLFGKRKKEQLTILSYDFFSNLLAKETLNRRILTPITISNASAEVRYYTMSKFQLKVFIELAMKRVRTYYEDLLTKDVKHKDYVLKQKIYLFNLYLNSNKRSMIIDWDKDKPFVSNSGLLEYDIFNLVSLYKIFDWKHQKLVLEFYEIRAGKPTTLVVG